MRYRVVGIIQVYILLFLFTGVHVYGQRKGSVMIMQQTDASPRIKFGVQKLAEALQKAGYSISRDKNASFRILIIGELKSALLNGKLNTWSIPSEPANKLQKEGFVISTSGNKILI